MYYISMIVSTCTCVYTLLIYGPNFGTPSDCSFSLKRTASPNPNIEPASVNFYPPVYSRDRDPPEFTLSFAVTNAPPTNVTCAHASVDVELSSLSRRVLEGQYIVNENGTVEQTVKIEINVTLETRQAGDYQCTVSVFRANQPLVVPLMEATTPIVTVTGKRTTL